MLHTDFNAHVGGIEGAAMLIQGVLCIYDTGITNVIFICNDQYIRLLLNTKCHKQR